MHYLITPTYARKAFNVSVFSFNRQHLARILGLVLFVAAVLYYFYPAHPHRPQAQVQKHAVPSEIKGKSQIMTNRIKSHSCLQPFCNVISCPIYCIAETSLCSVVFLFTVYKDIVNGINSINWGKFSAHGCA